MAAARRKLVFRDPARLVAYEKNARTHTPAQIGQIRASIDAFGPTNPILIDEHDRIVAGHGRAAAALLDPKLAEFPCIVLAGLTDDQRRALIIADNKLALNAGWDVETLSAELADLRAAGTDLALLGFSAADLEDFLPGDAPPPKPDFAYKEQYGCIVMCKDEASQAETYRALTAAGYQVKVVAT